jgi:hypothetical protein
LPLAQGDLAPVDPKWASGIIVIAQDTWPIEEIDRFINNSGYIGLWLRRNLPELPPVVEEQKV